MSREGVHKIHDTLIDLPLVDRVTALIACLVGDDLNSPRAIAIIIEVAVLLSKHLPPEQQAAVCWHLRAAAEELNGARWQ
jgi:hypothetical protein